MSGEKAVRCGYRAVSSQVLQNAFAIRRDAKSVETEVELRLARKDRIDDALRKTQLKVSRRRPLFVNGDGLLHHGPDELCPLGDLVERPAARRPIAVVEPIERLADWYFGGDQAKLEPIQSEGFHVLIAKILVKN